MNVNRRFVIKGLAAGAVAGSTMGVGLRAWAGSPLMAPGAGTASPPVALVSAGNAEILFTHGARAAAGPSLQVRQLDQSLGALLNIERLLHSGELRRAVGLLDDATATLVIDLARSAGARVEWIGRHNSRSAITSHRLITTGISGDGARQLSSRLDLCGAGYRISETRCDQTTPDWHLNADPRSDQYPAEWVSTVGYFLTSLHGPAKTSPPAPLGHTPLSGSFVSFSIVT